MLRSSALALLVASSAACTGGFTPSDPSPASPPAPAPAVDALRTSFASKADLVLHAPRSFVARGHAFVSDAKRPQLAARLDADASQGVRLASTRVKGFEIKVTEEGARGSSSLVERAVAFDRKDGRAYWSATERGAEEWLAIDASAVTRDKPVARIAFEGARAEQENDTTVAFVDDKGIARIRAKATDAFTASGRRVAVKLRLDERDHAIEIWANADRERLLIDPEWVSTGNLGAPRYTRTGAKLNDGRVAIIGGTDSDTNPSTIYDNIEIYDPSSDVWSLISGSMQFGRVDAGAAVLPDGTLFITGGYTDLAFQTTGATDLYDPVNDAWNEGPSMPIGVAGFTFTPRGDGSVLACGGFDTSGAVSAACAVVPPTYDDFTEVPGLSFPRQYAAALLLPDGTVAIAGGDAGFNTPLDGIDICDGVNSCSQSNTHLAQARFWIEATFVPPSTALFIGGEGTSGPVNIADVIDTTSFLATQPVSLMIDNRNQTHGVYSPALNGVVVAGGYTPTIATEVYQPVNNTFVTGPDMASMHNESVMFALDDGTILIAGGDPQGTTERLDPTLGLPCSGPTQCLTGFCSPDGVCCDQACDGFGCQACTIANGAVADGTCANLDGFTCDDGDPCSANDACVAGQCTGSPMTCLPPDDCHDAGDCDPQTGSCSSTTKPDGTTCNAGQCFSGATCVSGACQGGTQKTCTPPDACHVGNGCNTDDGSCLFVALPDGAPCGSGTCFAGACIGDPDAGPLTGSTTSGDATSTSANGTSASAGSGSATSGAGGASSSSNGDNAQGSGCSVSPGSRERSGDLAGLFALALILSTTVSRRRRVA